MMLSVCRSCLSSGTNFIDVHEMSYKHCFMELANISITKTDGLPQSICHECAHLFTKFSNFKKTVVRSHQLLLQSLEKKKEIREKSSYIHTSTAATKPQNVEAEIKVENCIIITPSVATETNHISQCESDDGAGQNDDYAYSEKIVSKKKKSKKKTKIRSKKTPKFAKSATKGRVIELDEAKIETIILSEKEQRERHEREATSSAFLSMPHRCMMCYKGFNYERKLQAHIENWHKENAKHICKICHRTLKSASTLAMHQVRHDTLYQCRLCLQCLVEKKQAIAHYQSVHEGIDQLVTCKICGQSFRHRSTLNGHLRSRHPSVQRPICDICGKSFVTKDSLLDHLLIHSGVKAHACSCGKKFRLKSELVVHSLSHTPSGQYHCIQCDKHFKTYTTYNRHLNMSLAHINPELQAHCCSVCGRGFTARWQLRVHSQSHTGTGSKYKCTTCGVQIASQAGLRKHVRVTHLGIQPPKNYVCHACGKTFSYKRMLENHIRTHTGEKPFACGMEQCGARFSQKSTLQTHTRLVHLKLKRGTKKQTNEHHGATSV